MQSQSQQALAAMLLEALRLACPEGLEPPTYCLEGNCSIQLSYGQMCESKDCASYGKTRDSEAPPLIAL